MQNEFLYLKATPNYSRRTFTVRLYYSDGSIKKFPCGRFTQDEFQAMLKYGQSDWLSWLESVDYCTVRIIKFR